jgi:hypothetical protein
VLPRFSKVKQQTEFADSVLLTLSWGTLALGITLSRKPLEYNFENTFYPHQRLRNFVAIFLMVSLHLFLAYFLLYEKVEPPLKQGDEKGKVIVLNLYEKNEPGKRAELANNAPLTRAMPPARPRKQQHPHPLARSTTPKPTIKLPARITDSGRIGKQIAKVREKQHAQEEAAAQSYNDAQLASEPQSEDDIAMARIKANIEAANYHRKGKNGIFQIVDKGVQTGRFSFRGWDNNPRQSTWQTYEVDAGVGGNVELALIRRIIEIIHEHYPGDFNWESQRLGRVVVLSARPADAGNLERFMMKEFFESK